MVSDISCIPDTVSSPDPKKTVFVGGVHGMVTSQVNFFSGDLGRNIPGGMGDAI